MEKYIVVQSTRTGSCETFEDTPQEAIGYAEYLWRHLTEREKKKTNISVHVIDESCVKVDELDEDEFLEDGTPDWSNDRVWWCYGDPKDVIWDSDVDGIPLWYIDLNPLMERIPFRGTLEEAQGEADRLITYNGHPAKIADDEGDDRCIRRWWSREYNEDEDWELDPIKFGEFGFYSDWEGI